MFAILMQPIAHLCVWNLGAERNATMECDDGPLEANIILVLDVIAVFWIGERE
jgi:hypothetical protein